ncbi:MAG: hypothetical protein JNN11_04165 [Candidatus Doudnabacteria bacterium]|nr:hypothetical protein [Candidatus Doudnabacteria bacterium]
MKKDRLTTLTSITSFIISLFIYGALQSFDYSKTSKLILIIAMLLSGLSATYFSYAQHFKSTQKTKYFSLLILFGGLLISLYSGIILYLFIAFKNFGA